MSEITKIVRKHAEPTIAAIRKRHDALTKAAKAEEQAQTKAQQVAATVGDLTSQREALRGSYGDALFTEDQQRVKGIQAERKRLDKEITAASKSHEKAQEALNSVAGTTAQVAAEAHRACAADLSRLARELTEFGEELTGSSGPRYSGRPPYGGVIGKVFDEARDAAFEVSELANRINGEAA